MRWPFKRRAGSPPAAGADPAPVPGERAPAKAAIPPARPSPAPGSAGHGGLLQRTDTYVCGRKVLFDYDRGTRTLEKGCECAPRTDWDAAMRKLLDQP
jgi:hypothetical protein